LLALTLTTPCFAQDNTAPKPDGKPAGTDDAQLTATMMEMAKPGENHKLLEGTVGSWSYKVKWWMSPDAPPMEINGTCSTKSVLDGRYFVTDHASKMTLPGQDGKMMEMEYKGTSTEGYDNAKKQYVATWIDNMGTGIMTMEGTYDPATKTLTYLGEAQPAPGTKFKVRQTITFADKDHRKMEWFETHHGAEVKTMAIDYIRST
jgi:hypothetical protein